MVSSQNYDRRAVFAWAMYDFANSSFSALVLTFIFSTYFTKAIAPDEIVGTALWSRGLTVSALTVAFLSPFMGALADTGGYRKRILFVLTVVAIIGTASLYTSLPGQTLKALTWFVFANIGMEMGMVFYNAYLPDIAPPEKIGRISGYGWSFGYVGGLLAMLIAMILFVTPQKPIWGLTQKSHYVESDLPTWSQMSLTQIENKTGFQVVVINDTLVEIYGVVISDENKLKGIVTQNQYSTKKDTLSLSQIQKISNTYGIDLVELGLKSGNNIRATNILVAVWFGVFSLPLFFLVKERKLRNTHRKKNLFSTTFTHLKSTFHEIKRYRQIIRLLVARLFYNDAILTIFSFGGIYAAGTFNFSFTEILIFGIVLNITAGLGAFALGFLDDIIGGKKTIQISNYAFILATLIAIFAPNKLFFWVAGIIVGLFSGPNQAASRSLMCRFVPADKETEFFGFYAFSGKATAFIGPLFLGILTEMFNSQRAGISIVLILFIVGSLILRLVDEEEGKRLSGRS